MNEQQFIEFASKISVMKPAVAKEDNPNEMARVHSLLTSNDYAAEEKIDGCHYMCFGYRFFSTEGVEKTQNYPHLFEFFSKLCMPNLILDGEINYPGRTSQYCTRVTGCGIADAAVDFQNENGPIHYTVWDMLRLPSGRWLINEPYDTRRAILEEFYKRFIANTSLAQYIHLTTVQRDNKKEFYDEIIADGREGIVLKKRDSLYIMGKKPKWQWMKLKQKDTADYFISGFVDPKREYTGNQIEDWPYWREINGVLRPVTENYYNDWIGSIELSAYVDGEPTVICTCSGISKELRADMSTNRSKYINKVVKVSFMEKTEAGYPRHPRFEQFHESKLAQECLWELVRG